MTNQQLRSTLIWAGMPASLWQLADDTYEPVSREWVRDNWVAWLDARPAELCVFGDVFGKRVRTRPLWIADVSDCDNHALGVVAHGQVGNALSGQAMRGLPRGGLAFGVVFYIARPGRPENFGIVGSHAINWFLDHDGRLHFFEPAMGVEVDINTEERASAWFGLAA